MKKLITFFKRIGVFLTAMIWIATLILSFYLGVFFQWAATTDLVTNKDYSQIVVKENTVADYQVFVDIPEEYMALKEIKEPLRRTISLYMQVNDLKLAEGVHEFKINNGSLDEYINQEFKFVPIKE